jgi:hypothetical protein
MIYDKHGKKVELDSTIYVGGLDHSVSDVDGDVIMATSLR